jgi:hypothetical protein
LTIAPNRSLRPLWEAEVLDFLTVRGRVVFSDWNVPTVRGLTTALAGADWEAVLGAQILASERTAEDLRRAYHLAPREMERNREEVGKISRGRLRGRVDARGTLALRRRKQDETLWLVRRSVRHWQTDDNAAIAGFLSHLLTVSAEAASGAAGGWRARVAQLHGLIERLLRAEPMRHVSPSSQWPSHEIPPSLVSRAPFYRLLWPYARAWRESVWSRDPAAIRERLGGGWLLAEDDDQLFELFVLSRLVEVIARLGPWDEFVIKPSVVNSQVSLVARQGEIEITLRYDRAPQTGGMYRWLFRSYEGVDVAVRRPDLQLTVSGVGPRPRTCLIEVKATNSTSPYGRESAYKVLGYLKDYADLWKDEAESRYPRAMVVFASGITPLVSRSDRVRAHELLLSDHSILERDLSALVLRMLEQDGGADDEGEVPGT